MNNLAVLPTAKQQLLTQLVAQLRQIPQIVAIVLGGSYARGTQREGSDMDVALYYAEAEPFSIAEVKRIANTVSVQGEPVVTGFYEWGAWVNGGAWIHTSVGKVDFLYRNLDQVTRTIAEAQRGIVHHDYPQQPAYGFYSVIYLAETQVCIPLHDPAGRIAALKQQVAVYPVALKAKLVSDSLWSAEFTLLHGRDYASAGDVYNTIGCLTRAAANLTQALFALNERYFMSDKKVMASIAALPHIPSDYVSQLEAILAQPGADAEALGQSVRAMHILWQRVVALTGGTYEPKFRV